MSTRPEPEPTDVSPEGVARLQTAYARSERMVGRRIGDEYVLVPIVGRGADVDSLFTLSPVAAFIWERLDGTQTGDAILDAILECFDVPRERAEQDYLAFLTQLLSIRAVR